MTLQPFVERALLVCLFALSSCANDPVHAGTDVELGSAKLTSAGQCAAADAAQPFGSRKHYAAGIAVSRHTRADLERATLRFYEHWKTKYLARGCAPDTYRVATGIRGSFTVSEAHGYGMLLAAFFAGYDPDARHIFDGLHRYFRNHPSTIEPDLMAWSQTAACADDEGPDSATDGDLDIAYALLLAHEQWGSQGKVDYLAEAKQVIRAIQRGETTDAAYVNLGDWAKHDKDYKDSTRSSDFMPGHFHSFAEATGDAVWRSLLDRSYEMMSSLQRTHAPRTGLLPDFIAHATDGPRPAPANFLEARTDGSYSWNACRDPLRIGIHYLTTGDGRAKRLLAPINTWMRKETGDSPHKIRAGYELSGVANPNSNYPTMAFIAPLAVAAMSDAHDQAWLNELWDFVAGFEGETYFEDTLKLLSMLVMSGNWWTPEAPPCAISSTGPR